MTTRQTMVLRGLLIFGVFLLGGCSSSVTIPVSELPLLSTQRIKASRDWVEVQEVDGERTQIIGEIDSVDVRTSKDAFTVDFPFMAWSRGSRVEIHQPPWMYSIPLDVNSTAIVHYADRHRTRAAIGSFMAGIGAPAALIGIAGLVLTGDEPQRHLETTLALSIISGLGLGLTISGALIALTMPEKTQQSAIWQRSKFLVAADHVGLSVTF